MTLSERGETSKRRDEMKKIVIGIVIGVAIGLVIGVAPIVATEAHYDTNQISYEVLNVYRAELTAGYLLVATVGGARFDPLPKANVEIKNTGSIAGLFRVFFNFSEEYSGYDLIYLEPGETGVACYTVLRDATMNRGDYLDKIADWDYEVTPVVLNQNPEKNISIFEYLRSRF
jgi:hypothetical protein